MTTSYANAVTGEEYEIDIHGNSFVIRKNGIQVNQATVEILSGEEAGGMTVLNVARSWIDKQK